MPLVITGYFTYNTSKTVWYWLKDRHIDQWNVKENSGIDSHQHAQLMFLKGAKAASGGIDITVFSASDAAAPRHL